MTNPTGTIGYTTTSRTIAETAATEALKGLPATTRSGGAPVLFEDVVNNPTPSVYTNLDDEIAVVPGAVVQRQVSGSDWVTLPYAADDNRQDPPSVDAFGPAGLTLQPGASKTAMFRVSFTRTVKPGVKRLINSLVTNGSPKGYGTSIDSTVYTVTLGAAPTGTGTTGSTGSAGGSTGSTGGSTGSTGGSTGTATAGAGTNATGTLAHTGAPDTGLIAGGAAALLAAGASVLMIARKRRSGTA